LAEIIEKQAKASVGARRRTGGARRLTSVVRARASDFYRMSFNGRERAIVMANALRGADIDLAIYDQYGRLVARDTRYNSRPMVTWVPRWSAPFSIRVINPNYRPVAYTLTTN
jgi:hypothetical protein